MTTFKAALAKRKSGLWPRREVPFSLESGVECVCAVRMISAAEEAAAMRDARAFAKEQGLPDPRPGDELYEMGLAVATLARAGVDPEVEDRDVPYFDGGQPQILEELDRDRIMLLAEAQSTLQAERGARPFRLSLEEYSGLIVAHALKKEGEPLPCEQWHPLLRRAFIRAMAERLIHAIGERVAIRVPVDEDLDGLLREAARRLAADGSEPTREAVLVAAVSAGLACIEPGSIPGHAPSGGVMVAIVPSVGDANRARELAVMSAAPIEAVAASAARLGAAMLKREGPKA